MVDIDNEHEGIIISETSKIIMEKYSMRAENQRTINEDAGFSIETIRKFTSGNYIYGRNPKGEMINPLIKAEFSPHEIKQMREFLKRNQID